MFCQKMLEIDTRLPLQLKMCFSLQPVIVETDHFNPVFVKH